MTTQMFASRAKINIFGKKIFRYRRGAEGQIDRENVDFCLCGSITKTTHFFFQCQKSKNVEVIVQQLANTHTSFIALFFHF